MNKKEIEMYEFEMHLGNYDMSDMDFRGKVWKRCQWNGILQMNKALTPENERRVLRRMKSVFFQSVKWRHPFFCLYKTLSQ